MIDNKTAVQLCGALVSGGLASYPCVLPGGHRGSAEGMHVAVEAPVTRQRYDAWLSAHPTPEDLPPTVVGDGRLSVLDPTSLSDPDQREAQSLLSTTEEEIFDVEMTRVLKQSVASLAVLWAMCQSEYASGARGVVVTPEFLSRLTTPRVRAFIEQLAYPRGNQQVQTKEQGPT